MEKDSGSVWTAAHHDQGTQPRRISRPSDRAGLHDAVCLRRHYLGLCNRISSSQGQTRRLARESLGHRKGKVRGSFIPSHLISSHPTNYSLAQLFQTWLAMLQMVPLLSKESARLLVKSNPHAHCFRSLFLLLNESSLPPEQRSLLLQHSFDQGPSQGQGRCGEKAQRRNCKRPRIAKSLFQLMTSEDPELAIGKD